MARRALGAVGAGFPVTQSEVIGAGINATDVVIPLEQGGKAGVFGGAGMGKTLRVSEMIYNMVSHHDDASIFFGIGEHCRECEGRYHDMQDTGVLENMVRRHLDDA